MDAIHGVATDWDVVNLLKCIENGVSMNWIGGPFVAISLPNLYNIFKCANRSQ